MIWHLYRYENWIWNDIFYKYFVSNPKFEILDDHETGFNPVDKIKFIFSKFVSAATIYTFSFLSGVGGAFIWVGQGAEVLANSDENTVDRNTAAFWLIYQMSQFGWGVKFYLSIQT